MLKSKELPLEKIEIGEHEQRMEADDEGLEELSASIGRLGVVVPITVCPKGDKFLVVAGHRRTRAARKLGLSSIPAIIREAKDAEVKEVAFAENLFRRDLTPLEFASAMSDCVENEIMTVEELAVGLRRTTEWVCRMISLLKWPTDVLNAIHGGWISVAAASNLALITDDTYRDFLLRNAHDNGATARTTAAWLQAFRSMAPSEQAIEASPVAGGERPMPMVPQAPCLACGQVFRTDQLSHVPICGPCIQAIRNA